MFNIDVLLIPPHTSHLLLVFDVSIAFPLKTYFGHELNKLVFDASTKACTLSNITSGFAQTGILPLNPEKPLSSDFTMDDQNTYVNRSKNNLPTLFLNSEIGLKHLFREENGREITQNDISNIFDQVFKILTQNLEISSGIPLSKIPDIFIEKESEIEKLEIPI